MPDGKRDVTDFTRYFGINTPKAQYLTVALIIAGAATGIITELFIHSSLLDGATYYIVFYGASTGIVVVALPAILTALLIKAMNRRLRLKHGMIAVLAVTVVYCLFLVVMAAAFRLTNSYVVAYIIFIAANAAVYGYWFMINRIVLNQRKSQIFTAAVQPMLNTLLYIPESAHILSLHLPVNVLLIKLWAGMFIFVLCGYAILYFMDRPSKRQFNFSGVEFMSGMVHQWLYDASIKHDVLEGSGTERNVNVDILSIKSSRGANAVFVMPDIHFGPIMGLGGAVATEQIGARIAKTGASPFVIHGPVNMEDNPTSSSEVSRISNAVSATLRSMRHGSAYGAMGVGRSGPCTAVALAIGDTCILSLTKAPKVTEDIDRSVGEGLAKLARKHFQNVILIDAHNSRFESAPSGELRGIYNGSKYVAMYERAVSSAMLAARSSRRQLLSFGCASASRGSLPQGEGLGEDLGRGHLGVAVFGFGSRRFCMVYFDSNNMLPSFRSDVIGHIRDKFGIEAEAYTTDTHGVNTLSLPVSNVLGRRTRPSALMPAIDALVAKSLRNMGHSKVSYSHVVLKRFKVWGKGSEEMMTKISRDVIRLGKRLIPALISGFFVLAMLIIYVA
ncbi:MAG: DUF2070 family protein [Candidatus Marsarchaeota archaeon]|nr:DUF2070 family protein [Candidatus Marsarchaeota archaeon]